MGAPKRTQLSTTWLSPRQTPNPPASFKRRVLGYPGTNGAFQKLTSQGLDENLLWRHLWGLAALARKGKQQYAPWYAIPGLPSHSLRRFPDRVRGWAREIETTKKAFDSSAPYRLTIDYLPPFLAGSIPSSSVKWRVGGNVFQEVGTAKRTVPVDLARRVLDRRAEIPKLAQLPDLLRFYADYVEAVSKLTAQNASKAPTLLGVMPLELIKLVDNVTGKPNFDQVATLLTASMYAIGLSDVIDPRNLKAQYSRRSRKK